MAVAEDIIVIGAGPAGLALAYELKRRGLTPTMLEASDEVAASWRTRHDHLQLNTHRAFSHQPGMRMPRALGAFPSKDDYIAYLERYADWIDVPIRFSTPVHRIDAEDAVGRWTVLTGRGELSAQHVVVATGSDREPVMPDWPGREAYGGTILHAGRFRNAAEYAHKAVLIVGAGNSAFDLGNYLARVPLRPSCISVRRTTTIVPKTFLGIPSQALLVLSSWLPEAVQDVLVGTISRLFLGDLSRIGLAPPDKGGLRKFREEGVTLAVDDGFASALKAGTFAVVPPVARLDERGVTLADGRYLEPDVIICATGYRPGLEPLVGHLGVLDPKGYPLRLGGDGIPGAPGLWFLGQNSSPYGNMNIRRREARRLAANIAGSQ